MGAIVGVAANGLCCFCFSDTLATLGGATGRLVNRSRESRQSEVFPEVIPRFCRNLQAPRRLDLVLGAR